MPPTRCRRPHSTREEKSAVVAEVRRLQAGRSRSLRGVLREVGLAVNTFYKWERELSAPAVRVVEVVAPLVAVGECEFECVPHSAQAPAPRVRAPESWPLTLVSPGGYRVEVS